MKQKIIPISELSNYTKVVEKVSEDNSVILTKNGYGKYVVLDLDYFESLLDELDHYKEKSRVMELAFNDAYKKVENKDDSLPFDDYKKLKGW